MGLNKQVVIVGCGPGGSGYLTGMAVKAVESADAVIGTAKFLALFPAAKARVMLNQVRTEEIARLIDSLDCHKVAVLVSGDTGLCSLASSLRGIAPAGWEVRFVPGVSSIQATCALFTLEWQDMRFFSLHYRPAPAELAEAAARGEQPLAVLCGPGSEPEKIARLLLDTVEPDRQCHVACNIGSEEQAAWSGPLSGLAQKSFGSQSVLIVDRRTR